MSMTASHLTGASENLLLMNLGNRVLQSKSTENQEMRWVTGDQGTSFGERRQRSCGRDTASTGE